MYVKEWLAANFTVSHFRKDEAQMNCPECGHERFYFNVDKKVGWCHRASCNYTPKLKDLVDLVGDLVNFDMHKPAKKEIKKIQLPKGCSKVVVYQDVEPFGNSNFWTQDYVIKDMEAYNYLISRGINKERINDFNICVGRSDTKRVYVPIYHDKELVSYVSRSILPNYKGYLYPHGGRHNHTIFRWDSAKLWNRIRLVENTFVAIANNDLGFSTTFGSHLSDEQATLICNSHIKQVLILWDDGAEVSAQKAVKKLNNLGIRASFVKILGQPDDYSKGFLRKLLDTCRERTEECIDYRAKCFIYKAEKIT